MIQLFSIVCILFLMVQTASAQKKGAWWLSHGAAFGGGILSKHVYKTESQARTLEFVQNTMRKNEELKKREGEANAHIKALTEKITQHAAAANTEIEKLGRSNYHLQAMVNYWHLCVLDLEKKRDKEWMESNNTLKQRLMAKNEQLKRNLYHSKILVEKYRRELYLLQNTRFATPELKNHRQQ